MIIPIHPQTPQSRQVERAVGILKGGGILAYPTDTLFAIGCDTNNNKAVALLSRIAGRDKSRTFTFLCHNFSQADRYAKISKDAFRIMKHCLPGPYTFVLPATSMVPKKIAAKRKTVGIRIPDHCVCQALVAELGVPLASTSIEVDDDVWAGDAYSVESLVGHLVYAVVDGGVCGCGPSSVVDLTGEVPVLLREGKGDISFLRELVGVEQ